MEPFSRRTTTSTPAQQVGLGDPFGTPHDPLAELCWLPYPDEDHLPGPVQTLFNTPLTDEERRVLGEYVDDLSIQLDLVTARSKLTSPMFRTLAGVGTGYAAGTGLSLFLALLQSPTPFSLASWRARTSPSLGVWGAQLGLWFGFLSGSLSLFRLAGSGLSSDPYTTSSTIPHLHRLTGLTADESGRTFQT